MTRITIIIVLLCMSFSCGSDSIGTTGGNARDTKISFADVSKTSGVEFTHIAGRSQEKWMPEVLGGGVAIADFNRDGAPDIFFTNSGKYASEKRPDDAANRLFLNDGRGKFTDRSSEWNVTGVGYGEGVAVGDIDNDGLTDLFLTNVEGANRLLRNTGEKFEDITDGSGIKPDGKWAKSAGFGDFDNDGDLDLFVVKYIEYSEEDHKKVFNNKMLRYTAPYLYPGVSDQIWLNDGKGKFTDASIESGISESAQKGLALAIGDIDKDGDTDVYVANDTTPNQLWLNDGTGKFEDVARLWGCAYSETGKEEGSMGADFSDTDSNGFLDIAVTNFQEETTALYVQSQSNLFREISDAAGIGLTARSRLSFGIDFFDADNDGDEDLLVANGHMDDTVEMNSESVKFAQQNTLYENVGGGKFADVSDSSGQALKVNQLSRGLAVADLDSDGDLDFVIANNNGAPQIAFNETVDKGNFVGLLLEGKKSNRNAIGTRLLVKIGENTYERQIMGSQSYLSISEFRIFFGMGKAAKIDSLEVFWAGGEKQTLLNIEAGKYYHLKEGKDLVEFIPGQLKASE